jgi:hypothetical protein
MGTALGSTSLEALRRSEIALRMLFTLIVFAPPSSDRLPRAAATGVRPPLSGTSAGRTAVISVRRLAAASCCEG